MPGTSKTKTKPVDLDFGDDILNPSNDNLPVSIPDEPKQGNSPKQHKMDLPVASRATTQDKLRGMTPSDTMRDYMNRINRDVDFNEPDAPENTIVQRTNQDIPAVIRTAMKASGNVSPEWHTINNLPGFGDRHIRGMGRQIFGMFTSTPLEDIKTIANVNGQGPNTPQEVRSVASWLKNNAEDLGEVNIDHGPVIRGYRPDVKEFRINDIRFHVVRDPMGEYIYAYPDKDSRIGAGMAKDQIEHGRPRLREFAGLEILRPTLFEQLKWDEEIDEILRESDLDEEIIDESTLSKLVGKNPGAKNLIKWLHRKHKLGNDADIVPARMNSKRLLWKSFKSNPDQFIVVVCRDGVAGIKPDEQFIKSRTEEFAKKGKEYNPGGDNTLPYELVAFKDDGEELDPKLFQAKADADGNQITGRDPRVIKARMGLHTGKDMQNPDNVFNLIAEQLGPITSVYLTGEAPEGDPDKVQPEFKGGVEREKLTKRADMKKGPAPMSDEQALAAIIKKVRPVMKQLAFQAQSQITRSAQRYMNGGNFEAGQKLMKAGAYLQKIMVNLDTSGDIGVNTGYNSPSKEISYMIVKAIEQASGAAKGTQDFNDWANNAARGNSAALKPVLDAIRDNLVQVPANYY